MAKIEDSKPKKSSGAFERLLDNKQMANIFVKAQSTVITNGTELEKIISHQAQVHWVKHWVKHSDKIYPNKKRELRYSRLLSFSTCAFFAIAQFSKLPAS